MKMIVIGSSWGGLEPTKVILDELPDSLDAAVLIVRHSTPGGESVLTPILAPHSEMPVSEVTARQPVQAGHVYVTPPGITVTMNRSDNGRMYFVLNKPSLTAGKGRPSIDDALSSAAMHFGEDCIGVILSGYLNDGTRGAIRIDRVNGTTIVQQPSDAQQPSMPLSVIKGDSPDFVVPDIEIGAILRQLVSEEHASMKASA